MGKGHIHFALYQRRGGAWNRKEVGLLITPPYYSATIELVVIGVSIIVKKCQF
jgi:hypothetical protein